jgi:TPR repeat protein
MGRQYGRVAWGSFIAGLATALLLLPSVSLAVAAASQPDVSKESGEVVDAAEAERRGFQALPVDQAQAVQWFEQAARAGRPAAQWMLGRHYFDAKDQGSDAARAVELIRAAAVQGLAPAQAFLGWMYSEGVDVERNPEQAFAWFSAAARQEDAYALLMLSGFYANGVATERNPELAQRLLMRSAELGDLDAAMSMYAWMLYGPAEARNSGLAIHFLTKAAKANDGRAAYALAREYLRGVSVQHDPALAAQWMQRSADGGNALASLWLSELHFKGFGVARDSTRAEKLLSEALGRASMQEKNQFAWDLSVGVDEKLRDGSLAVRVLEPALQAVKEKVTAHVDTLAAAYAEVKQFDRAVVTQLSAIERAKRERSPQEMLEGMMERLKLYERGQPYREIQP